MGQGLYKAQRRECQKRPFGIPRMVQKTRRLLSDLIVLQMDEASVRLFSFFLSFIHSFFLFIGRPPAPSWQQSAEVDHHNIHVCSNKGLCASSEHRA